MLDDASFRRAAVVEFSRPSSYEPELDRLAALSPIEYDRERESAAERLGCRVATLDREVSARRDDTAATDAAGGSPVRIADPAPWPEPVNGAALLSELAERIERHVRMGSAAADAVALWIIHAHAHDSAAISPVLAITSPILGCGKTTLLSLIGTLVPRPLIAANITGPTLFRAVEKWQPSLLIDEADSFLKGSDELRGILNSGHNRANAFVLRTVGEDHEPRAFGTWSPKAIALIGDLPATLASRSIHIELRRLAPDECVEPFRADRPPADLDRLLRQTWRWAQEHLDELREAEPDMPARLRGRSADNWRHLLAIADVAGGEWPNRARAAAESLAGSRAEGADDATTIALLTDLRDLFAERSKDRLPSAEIVEHLRQMEDRPWPEWRQGAPITPRQLASLLKPFRIEPRTLRIGSTTPKGYVLGDLEDAFSRYLPQQSATPPHSNGGGVSRHFRSATADEPVADRERLKRL